MQISQNLDSLDCPISNMGYMAQLEEAWAPVLNFESENCKAVKGSRLRQNTAVILENQHRAIKGYGRLEGIQRGILREAANDSGTANSTMNNYGTGGVGGTTLPAYTPGSRGGVSIGSHYNTTGNPSHPNDFYAPGDARVPHTFLPMVRRVFPELLANEIFSVQPMSGPVGLVFGLRYRYDADPLACLGPNDSCQTTSQTGQPWWGPDRAEAGYQYLNTAHTGASSTGIASNSAFPALPEDLGVAALQSFFEFKNNMPGMSLEVEKTAVEAGTRRIATKWSLELEQDLKHMHNLDYEKEITDGLAYELQAEIDRELLVKSIQLCLNGTVGKNWSRWSPLVADGRWMAEKNVVLYAKIIREAQLIGVRNRMGAANWLVVTPTIASMLTLLPQFKNFEVSANINPVVGNARLGTLGQFRVYQDTRTEGQYQSGARSARIDYVLMGYNGPKAGESGIIFAPYIPAMVQRAQGANDFNPRLGMITRYGVCDHLFGASNFYHLIIVQNLDYSFQNSCAPVSCGPVFYQ